MISRSKDSISNKPIQHKNKGTHIMFVKMFLINPIKKLEGSVSIDVGIDDFDEKWRNHGVMLLLGLDQKRRIPKEMFLGEE